MSVLKYRNPSYTEGSSQPKWLPLQIPVPEVDLSSYATKVDVGGKQDIALKFENKSASVWVGDSTYEDFPYRCDINCSGVTSSMYAEVVFGVDEAISGDYAPMCETKSNIVSIWSAKNDTITVPTILITK